MTAAKLSLTPKTDQITLREDGPRVMRNFKNRRGLLHTTITVADDEELHINNFHSTLPRPWTIDMRRREFSELTRHLEEMRDVSMIAVGDFNFNIFDSRKRKLFNEFDSFTGSFLDKTWQWRGMKTPIAANLDAAFWDRSRMNVVGRLGRILGYDHKPLFLDVSTKQE